MQVPPLSQLDKDTAILRQAVDESGKHIYSSLAIRQMKPDVRAQLVKAEKARFLIKAFEKDNLSRPREDENGETLEVLSEQEIQDAVAELLNNEDSAVPELPEEGAGSPLPADENWPPEA
jgi:hypothetical protein